MLLYNTRAMATSCISRNAYNPDYQFVCTRCNAKTESFKGGELLYYGPQVRENVMEIEFVIMYPSIIYSCGISPESIDYIDLVNVLQQRFHSISYLEIYSVCSGVCMISLCVYGSNKCASKMYRTSFSHIITS